MRSSHQKALSIIFLALFSITSFGKGNPSILHSINWEADIDFLARELPKNHPNLFFKLSEETFRKELTKLKQEVPELSKTEITLKIQKILARLGDDHTNVDFIPQILNPGVLPFKFQWFPEGIFVMQTQNSISEILGKRVISVNGISTDTIFKNISELLPAGNTSVLKQRVPFLMSFRAILNYGCSLPPQDTKPFHLIYEDDQGNRKSITLSTSPNSLSTKDEIMKLQPVSENLPLSMQHPQKLFWQEYLPEDSMLFIQYNRCTSREIEKKQGSKELASRMPSFRKFAKEIFSFLKHNEISKVVIDLRQNPGGSSSQGTELAALMGQWKEQNTNCQFFVLTGKRTYSSAIINTMDFIKYTDAIVVGEPTSGSPNHFGETKTMILPSSGLQISHSTKYFKLTECQGNTLMPDIKVVQTFEDYRNGIDRVLEMVKTY